MLPIIEVCLRIFLATLIGGCIGWERGKNNRPAGLRTHMLVCVGSATVMITGICLSESFIQMTTADPARLSAQVISGIGFLGAGAIIKDGQTIKGLTTAATLWVVACLGLTIGAGFYDVSLITGFFIILILTIVNRIEKATIQKTSIRTHVEMSCFNVKSNLKEVEQIIDKYNGSIKYIKSVSKEDELNGSFYVVKFELISNNCPKHLDFIDLFDDLSNVENKIQLKVKEF